jgi:peptidoglycan/LPS O-acetylase OafA/YrhL
MNRVGGLDKARALAALSVMLGHLIAPYLPGALRYVFTGAPAVIAFFVVSGFCIHYPYRDKPLPVFAFVTARFLRIGIPMMVAFYFAFRARLWEFNIYEGYILWSLVCELWYYALYPALLWATRFASWRTQWAISMVVAHAIAFALGSDASGNPYIFGPLLNWLVWLPAWLLGCMLAEDFRTKTVVPVIPARLAIAAAASGLTWLSLHTPLGLHLTLNAFAILVYFWLRNEINAARGRNFLDRVGVMSYSIYLFHVIPPAWLIRRWELDLHGINGLTFAASVAGCVAAYLLVERPAHRLSRRLFKRLTERPTGAIVNVIRVRRSESTT